MKLFSLKLRFLLLCFLAVILVSSFTSSDEGTPYFGCDASNSKSCVITYKDGSRVDATGIGYLVGG